ncbi:hypothetical protein BV210_19045 (plasmid) [Halorientalis sp. IM1011]|uniref:hypothetical protein n=1 Tax=Halorientalis sp. IM1011 TaxID=1932360 RepID=UPI00097CC3C2|nr:hypothetical protein [Halorientalis sp. IM1011]AQL44862.1 hypothetical protein BV210_19045 [Halorientalis sp. IM1011]
MSEPSPSRQPHENDISDIRNRTRKSRSGTASESTPKDSERVKHVQKEWQHRNLYVPEELDETLEAVRDEMSARIEAEFDGQMAVTRHFYPVLVRLGLSHIDNLSATEFADQVDRIPGVDSDELER